MMKTICCLCIGLLVQFPLRDAAIYSSLANRDNINLIELDSDNGIFLRQKLYGSRHRRSPLPGKMSPTVTEFDLKNDTTHNQALIHWSGNHSKVIFILTRKKLSSSTDKIVDSTLWRSSNYGKDYKLMTNVFAANAILKSYFISPSNNRKMIFVDAFNQSSRIWRSKDEGKTFTPVFVPFSVDKIDFHPENSDWLLGYDKLRRELYCSMDFGENWVLLGEEVTNERYFWYVKNVDVADGSEQDPSKIVFFEYRLILMTIIKRIYSVKSCYIPHCRPTRFQSHLDALENIEMDSLTVQNNYTFVQKAEAKQKLYVSYNRGPFTKAYFGFYSGHAQAHFHVISSDGGCVMLGVNHDNGLTHLFVSDAKGKNYRESMNHVRYFNRKISGTKVFNVDAYQVQGVSGTFVANKHFSKSNRTYITWNNGQTWTRITQNVKGEGGRSMPSCFNCSLNLHLSMEQTTKGYFMQSILAKKSFPGLIIAHGTYGRTVVDNPDEVMLFVSRDNGKSWLMAKKQRHFVVVANKGTVIVAVKMIFLRPVKELAFSYDYGSTWTTHTFTQVGVNIDGILTEPGEATPHLTLFGHKTYSDSWRIFQIDMTTLFPRNCIHPNDFENITLPAQVDGCHLGMIQTVERIKPDTHCFPLPHQFHRKDTYCICTMDDYQCDLDYIPSFNHTKLTCVREREGPIDDVGESTNSSNEDDNCINGRRNVSSGIRKIPGDKCINDTIGIYKKNEACSNQQLPVTTDIPKPSMSIQLLNKTKSAKVGENLIFSVQGVSNGNIVWHILPLERTENAKKKIQEPTNFTLVSREPGPYKVRAELQGTQATSNWILVKFWYPIEKVYIYHPPVVAHSQPYNVTAWTQTLYGLRGNHTLLGEVYYTWDVDMQGKVENAFSEENTYSGRVHPKIPFVQIRVTAKNPVSLQTTTGVMSVKEFTLHLVLEMFCIPPMDSSSMTDLWLQEFKNTVVELLLRTNYFASVLEEHDLKNGSNLFFHVPPGDPLKVFIYFAPRSADDTKDKLLKAAKEVEMSIAKNHIVIRLANHVMVSVKTHYLIDYDGVQRTYSPQESGSGAMVAVAISLVIIVLVIAFFTARHFLKKSRFNQYLHFRNLRVPSRSSHIVRHHDRAPIVEQEFQDDDLDTMEDLSGAGPTLQFRSS